MDPINELNPGAGDALGHNQTLLSWQAPEFINYPKGKRWFIAASVLLLSLIAYALYTDSATMAILFIVLGGTIYLTHNQEPKMVEIRITELGIFFGAQFFAYNTISAFWVVYEPPYVQTLNLKLVGKNSRRVTLQLNGQNPVELRKLLVREIPEIEGQGEPMLDVMTRLLRL